MELFEQLKQRQELEIALWRAEQQRQQLQLQLPRAKYDLREAKIALVEYESSPLRVWMDKRRGQWEEKLSLLRRNLREAETALGEVQQALQRQDARCQRREEELAPLRETGDTLACAGALEPGQRQVITRREALMCAEKLLYLLEENRLALEAAREWVRPNNKVESAPGMTEGNLLSQADRWAQKCYEQLIRIAECGILPDIHGYFMNPTGYICGVTRYNQIDRVVTALLAIGDAQLQMGQLVNQLRSEGIWEEEL